MNIKNNIISNFIPVVTEKIGNITTSSDIYSKLLEKRIIFLTEEITSISANSIVAQLLFLEYIHPKKDIQIYINSPGGSVTSGMSIYDTMNFITSEVSTICIGLAASMAALLLSSGSKNKRYCLPNSQIMIHQPLGSFSGQASDIEIHANYIKKIKKNVNIILAKNTGQSYKKIVKDTDRDNFMNAEEAKNYQIIDKILI